MASNDKTHVSASAETQAQTGSSEKDYKDANKPENKKDEIQFFEGTITKLVERPVLDRNGEETGEKETVEVLSDNLYPGEKLKRADDEEKAAKKADQARKDAKESARQRGTDK
jgi:hypothetical protein